MTEQLRDRADHKQDRRTALMWPSVALETVGATLCALAVIALDFNHTAAYVLLAIGAPLLLVGVLLIAWSAQ